MLRSINVNIAFRSIPIKICITACGIYLILGKCCYCKLVSIQVSIPGYFSLLQAYLFYMDSAVNVNK